ncbi:BQ2448_1215 [Microbotryum intermedium]|uniref:BQ2448_1215 protein n=1 Tax=Microbotryum intermedium TaxID=269621 RepID=A0A238FCH2_9BASI|nr:BQ2448_1215 [Microbotryum intermedium]
MSYRGGGASHLASIYGSEQDKVNCSFYLKIGACRHGERCSRKHIKPQFSQTMVVYNMYQNPAIVQGSSSNPHLRPPGAAPLDPNPKSDLSEEQLQEFFDKFYEDVYCEFVKYGNLLEMHVCDNVGDHLIGNVYARFDWEDEAQAAVEALNTRWYAGRPLVAELSPVTDFREACCRQNDLGNCDRGGFCNFMHLRHPSKSLLRELQREQRQERIENPDLKEEERRKEMEMFGGGGGGGGGGGDGGDYGRSPPRGGSRRY